MLNVKGSSASEIMPSDSYLIILGERVGDVLIPPLRCFFLGDRADCCSSSTTETPATV